MWTAGGVRLPVRRRGVFNPSVGIRPMWTRLDGHRDADHGGVSIPSVGIRPMWTTWALQPGANTIAFQSLSRDSTHVDRHCSSVQTSHWSVSIPQSGFDPCGPARFRSACVARQFQSLSRDSTHVDRSGRERLERPVTVFQSLSRDSTHVDPTTRPRGAARYPFQSLSRDSTHVDPRATSRSGPRSTSFNPSVGIRPMWTGLGAVGCRPAGSFNPSVGIRPMWTYSVERGCRVTVRFQSLSRDSTHVDREHGRAGQPRRTMFQSLSRDSTHVDLVGVIARHGSRTRFNPSVGIRPMWTRCGPRSEHQARRVSIPQSGFDPCGRPWATRERRIKKVSIPQSGFDPCGQPPMNV